VQSFGLSALAFDISADFAGVATAGRGEADAHAFALLVVWWGLGRSLTKIGKYRGKFWNSPVLDPQLLKIIKMLSPDEIYAQNSYKKPQ
jgi:hypothetical protein